MRRLVLVLGLFLAIATPAFAHVEVSPESAPRGGSGTFTFNVEDERDAANMNTVEFYFPEGVTADDIKPTAPAGWDFAFTASPGSVRFTHPAPAPDGDQSFTLAISPLPDTAELVFKTLVSYFDGTIDRWIDLQTGSKEPPHPAAVVKLTGSAPAATTTTEARATVTTVKRPDQGSNAGAITGVIIGAIVVVGAVIAVALRRGRAAAS
jgi:uncharacterized protein YcnI